MDRPNDRGNSSYWQRTQASHLPTTSHPPPQVSNNDFYIAREASPTHQEYIDDIFLAHASQSAHHHVATIPPPPPAMANMPAESTNQLDHIQSVLTVLEHRMKRVEQLVMYLMNCINTNSISTAAPSSYSSSTAHPTISRGSPTRLTGRPPSEAVSADKCVRKRDLENHCLPLYLQQPEPAYGEMQPIVLALEAIYPNLDRRPILSLVRKWFRKKREESSQKVFSICPTLFPDPYPDREAVERVLTSYREDNSLLDEARRISALDIENVDAARDFCFKKIESYLRRHFLK